jgi:hypothetical protein
MLCHAASYRTFSTIELAVSTSAAAVIDRHARMRLKRHFNPHHWTLLPELLMLMGLMSLISGLYFLEHFVDLLLAAILFGGAGMIVKYWRNLYVASQKEFDHIAETDFTGAQSIALARFEISASDLIHAEPCKFRSATTKLDIGHAFVGLRVGSDEKPRRSPHEYLVVNFGRAHLLVFRCVWDLTSGTTLWEETHEVAYRDIACVLLRHKKETIRVNLRVKRDIVPLWKAAGIVPINDMIQVPTDESVALRLVSGELIELAAWKRSGAGIPSGEGKKSAQNAQRLQKLVRELKQPSAAAPSSPSSSLNHAPATIRDVRSRQ